MQRHPSYKRAIASWLIAALLSTQIINFDVADALSLRKPVVEEYGIVAILVESGIYNDSTHYDGLRSEYGSYLDDKTLSDRIDRYAYDIQSELPMTKSLIIEVGADDEVEEIAAVLERLYFDGDDIEDEKNQLTGVVIVGDVPLPVVTKGGNKFLSMLPYTDFEDKIYIFSEETGNFERNTASSELAPEVWHGVIVPPSNGEDGNEQLSEYFDKNHLYHLGVTEYSEFDQKIFYGDMIAEEKAINEITYGSYEIFLDYWEEIAYYRYNKHLIADLYGQVSDVLAGDGKDNDGDGLIDEDPEDGIDNDDDGFVDEDLGDPFEGIDNDLDGQIDEDGTEDNDNDGDGKSDEDPPGDLNGDGCPGVCNFDDDNDSMDTDDDGWPTGMENLYFWDPDKKSIPFLGEPPGQELKDAFADLFIDEDPFACIFPLLCVDPSANLIPEWIHFDPNCFDDDGGFHPEWDDDEDGFCDEDTTEDNDADEDGKVDEDRRAIASMGEDVWENLPDIQTKAMFEELTKRYHDMFEKQIAQIQDWVDYTGRYLSSYLDIAGLNVSDVDSPMTLISKKDEYALTYLRAVNDMFEEQVDDVVDDLQEDVKLISNIEVSIVINFEPDDDDPDNDGDGEPDPHPYSAPAIYFLNHSTSSRLKPFDIRINGKSAADIESVEECSTYIGTYDESERGSQLVEGLTLYDMNTAGDPDDYTEYGGCFGNYADMSIYGSYVAGLQFCFPEVA
ncbi:MAG: hypothetical protein ACD_51C00347G0001, partial [uncultured bacterium]